MISLYEKLISKIYEIRENPILWKLSHSFSLLGEGVGLILDCQIGQMVQEKYKMTLSTSWSNNWTPIINPFLPISIPFYFSRRRLEAHSHFLLLAWVDQMNHLEWESNLGLPYRNQSRSSLCHSALHIQ